MQLADRYERVPYPGHPFATLHPRRLAATASLFGLDTAPVERCRVLEIGCASGGHLLPMAEQLPGSAFVGVDLAGAAIAAARAQAVELGLDNVRLVHGSFTDLPDEAPFDYVLAHGVYSWIDAPLRSALLGLCRDRLAPNGVALVSYNTLPGWWLRGMARDVMRLFPAAGGPEAEISRAREMLAWAAEHAPEEAPHAAVLRGEQELVAAASDAYLFHEHLAPFNDPVWFADFVTAAARADLRYVGEARLADMSPQRLGAAVQEAIAAAADDLLTREQLMDLLLPRYFRRTLLCRGEVALSRTVGPERMTALRFAPAGAVEPAEWFDEGSPHRPLALAVGAVLAEEAPQSVAFADLLPRVASSLGGAAAPPELGPLPDRLGRLLVDALARGEVDATVGAWTLARSVASRPTASALVRWQARRGATAITSQRHEPIAVDSLDRAVLSRLDGSLGAIELTQVIAELSVGVDPAALLAERLAAYARNALLL